HVCDVHFVSSRLWLLIPAYTLLSWLSNLLQCADIGRESAHALIAPVVLRAGLLRNERENQPPTLSVGDPLGQHLLNGRAFGAVFGVETGIELAIFAR